MRKQLGILTSLLFLTTTAFLWIGCSGSHGWGGKQSSYDQSSYDYDTGSAYDNTGDAEDPYGQATNDESFTDQNSQYQSIESRPSSLGEMTPINIGSGSESSLSDQIVSDPSISSGRSEYMNSRLNAMSPQSYLMDSTPGQLGTDSMNQGPDFMNNGPNSMNQRTEIMHDVPNPMNSRPDVMNDGPNSMNQRPDFMNGGPNSMNQGSDFMNDGPNSMNQRPDLMNGGPNSMNQGSDFMNGGPNSMNQRPDLMNGGPNSMNQGSDFMNGGPNSMNQRPDLMNDGPNSMNQGSDFMNGGPNSMNQRPDLMNDGPSSMNQTSDFMNDLPNPMNSRPDFMNDSSNSMNQRPNFLSEGPNSMNQRPDLMNDGPNSNQQTDFMNNGPNSMNQRPDFNNGPNSMNQRPDFNNGPNSMNQRPDFNNGPNGMNQQADFMNDGPRGMNQRPDFMNDGPRGMNQRPDFINDGPRGMNQRPDFINDGPGGMNQRPDFMNNGSDSMDSDYRYMNDGPRFMNPGFEQGPVSGSVSPGSCEDPACRQVRCHYPSSNELHCRDGIIVSAKSPTMCILGEQYPLDFDVRACDDVCDVVVTTHLPQGVSFMRSQPEGKVEGNKITWHFGPMKSGECRPAKVWLRCETEGEQCACFCATATPVRFCSLLCAKPVLTCEKCGPEEVCPGDPVHYSITVTNRGSCTAEDVVVTDNVPDGLEHNSCLRTLTFKLGCLEPCQSKKVSICFTAVKRGKICNTAVVTACNADSTSCQWCTNVCKECVEIVKVGPREQQIGKNADYQITVTNTGDKPLTDVIVTDNAPAATSIVAANGATVNGNQAIWRVREIAPGNRVTFTITLTTCAPGCFTNRVHVTDCQGCTACAEFTTRWRGRPALNVCICDTEDPICIGDTTSYSINVVNQGSEADDNVIVTVRFPKELEPLCAEGDAPGKVSGQTVSFEPYNNFGPRQTIRYRVEARGKASGDARVSVEVSSDSIRTPITQQESTIVN